MLLSPAKHYYIFIAKSHRLYNLNVRMRHLQVQIECLKRAMG